MLFTLEVFKKDGRKKEGKRLVDKIEEDFDSREDAEIHADEMMAKDKKLEITVHQTMIERINLMSKKPYTERYDTPISCSPAFETYWSM